MDQNTENINVGSFRRQTTNSMYSSIILSDGVVSQFNVCWSSSAEQRTKYRKYKSGLENMDMFLSQCDNTQVYDL